jgi:hypothetical protein
MRGISWLAERTLSFLRRTLLHGVSELVIEEVTNVGTNRTCVYESLYSTAPLLCSILLQSSLVKMGQCLGSRCCCLMMLMRFDPSKVVTVTCGQPGLTGRLGHLLVPASCPGQASSWTTSGLGGVRGRPGTKLISGPKFWYNVHKVLVPSLES